MIGCSNGGCGQHHEVGLDSAHSGEQGPPPGIGGPKLSTGKDGGKAARRQTAAHKGHKRTYMYIAQPSDDPLSHTMGGH